MIRHPYFDLWLDSDSELENVLGTAILDRTMLHEWPISCVQRLHCADGRSLIYKVQSPPTVEPAFYAVADSPLLVAAQRLPRTGMPDALILEDVQGKVLGDYQFDEQSGLELVNQILTQIGAIGGDLPALCSIRHHEEWAAFCETLYETLSSLISRKAFTRLNADSLNRLRQTASSPELLKLFDGPIGYLHGDLGNNNVLLTKDSYRVIDWQRPFWGPIVLDRVSLLRAVGLNSDNLVAPGVHKLGTLRTIDWFAGCASKWFPAGVQDYEVEIARLIQTLIEN